MAVKYISLMELLFLYMRLSARAVSFAASTSGRPSEFIRGLIQMLRSPHSTGFHGPTRKTFRHDDRYYWHLNVPGYPSPACDRILRQWIETKMRPDQPEGLYTGLVAITRKCPLSCLHCYEWDTLNQPGEPEESQLMKTIGRTIDLGPGQIILGGGEPAARFQTILNILDSFRDADIEFWINTSGTGLDSCRIGKLKEQGLTGVVFSLDHVDEKEHDRFRGRDGCHRHVLSLAKTASDAGLATALSLCATDRFVSTENLDSYMGLAAELGCMFVQILEAKPAGRNIGFSLEPGPDATALLDRFFHRASRRLQWPVLCCPDYDRRHHGCSGGRYYLYVDAAGKAFPCPFGKTEPVELVDLTTMNYKTRLSCRCAECFLR